MVKSLLPKNNSKPPNLNLTPLDSEYDIQQGNEIERYKPLQPKDCVGIVKECIGLPVTDRNFKFIYSFSSSFFKSECEGIEDTNYIKYMNAIMTSSIVVMALDEIAEKQVEHNETSQESKVDIKEKILEIQTALLGFGIDNKIFQVLNDHEIISLYQNMYDAMLIEKTKYEDVNTDYKAYLEIATLTNGAIILPIFLAKYAGETITTEQVNYINELNQVSRILTDTFAMVKDQLNRDPNIVKKLALKSELSNSATTQSLYSEAKQLFQDKKEQLSVDLRASIGVRYMESIVQSFIEKSDGFLGRFARSLVF